MSLEHISREEYFKVFENLARLGKPYYNEILSKTGYSTYGLPENYTNIFLKLKEIFSSFNKKKILEIGAGPGYLLYILKQFNADVYAIERRNFKEIAEKNGINFIHTDIFDITVRANLKTFDVIISRTFLESPVLSHGQVEAILKLTKPLSELQVHEVSFGTGYFHSINLDKFGYNIISYEVVPFLIPTEIYVLRVK